MATRPKKKPAAKAAPPAPRRRRRAPPKPKAAKRTGPSPALVKTRNELAKQKKATARANAAKREAQRSGSPIMGTGAGILAALLSGALPAGVARFTQNHIAGLVAQYGPAAVGAALALMDPKALKGHGVAIGVGLAAPAAAKLGDRLIGMALGGAQGQLSGPDVQQIPSYGHNAPGRMLDMRTPTGQFSRQLFFVDDVEDMRREQRQLRPALAPNPSAI